MKDKEKYLMPVNIVPHDNKYAKSFIIYNMAHGFLKIKTDNVDLVWNNLVKYNYGKHLFTLFPSRIVDGIIICKYVSRRPSIYSDNDDIYHLIVDDSSYITLKWLKDNIYQNAEFVDSEDNDEHMAAYTRGFYFDRTIKEILEYYKPEYVWNNDSKKDTELPIIIDDIMKHKIYDFLDDKAGELNEYLTNRNGMTTSLLHILNLSHANHIDSSVLYSKHELPNIITRFRIKGFKKHFDVAADIIRRTPHDEQTYISKVETEGNKATVEVINIRSFPWWSSGALKCKTIPDLRYYIELSKGKLPFVEDEYEVDIDYRLHNELIDMDFNISGVDHYQFDKDSKIFDTDEIFKKEQDYMQEALNHINDRRDSKRFGTSNKIELNLKFLYEETIENGEVMSIVTNITDKTDNVDIDAVLDYMKAYKTVFGLDGDIRETVVVGDESTIKESTNLISVIRQHMRCAGLSPIANISTTRDIRYYILNGLKSNEFGASIYFGNVNSHVMFTITMVAADVPKPELSDEVIHNLKNIYKETITDGTLTINRKKVQYERIK